jgi:hypothetical protein
MGHFAKVVDGKVTQVIVAEPEFFLTFKDTTPGEWIQTSYNTYGGEHLKGGSALRKNFAGIGFTYDRAKDAFIAPRPYPSWTLNNETCLWEPPAPMPYNDRPYIWNEDSQSWELVTS